MIYTIIILIFQMRKVKIRAMKHRLSWGYAGLGPDDCIKTNITIKWVTLFWCPSAYKSYVYTICCSVAQSCPTFCDPMDCSTLGFPVLHHLPEPAQTHVHWFGDTIQTSCPLLSPSPPAFYISQHQGIFQWVSSSHQVAKLLELQLQPQSFHWILRVAFL